MSFFPRIKEIKRRDWIMAGVMIVLCAVLFFVDTMPPAAEQPGTKERAVVLETDDSGLRQIGTVRMGTQILKVRMLSGQWKGRDFHAFNELRAQMDLDKVFVPGDVILAGVLHDITPEDGTINAQDYYRITGLVVLFALFALLLLAFGGLTGFNALLSFVFTCLVVWKLAVPCCLKGWNPLVISFSIVILLSAVIIFLVAGLNRKGLTAFGGTLAGVLSGSLLAWIFTHLFRINGATMPYAQSLINAGYEYLNLPDIFVGAIFLSSSGAVMDLAMDIAAGMDEVLQKQPQISRKELFFSGIRMGRSVVGTMTTTLLLAYSGGYLTLMMMFAAQGTLPVDFLNHPHVISEAVKTLVGSFGLVLVAPLTALLGAKILR